MIFFQKDHLGSTYRITDKDGNIVRTNKYCPYGSMFATTGSKDTTHKFTGQILDDNTGLYYYNARYYDPTLGMFITADTVIKDLYDPQVLNRYSYCQNNPIIYIDKDGHFVFIAWLVGAAVKGAIIGAVEGAVTESLIAAAEGKTNQQIADAAWGGFTKGAASGALEGVITGGVGAGLRYLASTGKAGVELAGGIKTICETYRVLGSVAGMALGIQNNNLRQGVESAVDFLDYYSSKKGWNYLEKAADWAGGQVAIGIDKTWSLATDGSGKNGLTNKQINGINENTPENPGNPTSMLDEKGEGVGGSEKSKATGTMYFENPGWGLPSYGPFPLDPKKK